MFLQPKQPLRNSNTNIQHKAGFELRLQKVLTTKGILKVQGGNKNAKLTKGQIDELMSAYERCVPYGPMIEDKWQERISKSGLKHLLRIHGLNITGTKEELWARLKTSKSKE